MLNFHQLPRLDHVLWKPNGIFFLSHNWRGEIACRVLRFYALLTACKGDEVGAPLGVTTAAPFSFDMPLPAELSQSKPSFYLLCSGSCFFGSEDSEVFLSRFEKTKMKGVYLFKTVQLERAGGSG